MICQRVHRCIRLFQIKALQANHFISHLIDVLSEDTASIKCDTTIATSATNETGYQSCTISSYDSEEEDSKDPISLSYNTNSESYRPDSPEYDSNRVLLCHNHCGQSLRFYCEDCETAICASCTDIGHRDHFIKRMAEAVEEEKSQLRALVDGAYTQVLLCTLIRPPFKSNLH